MLNNCRVYGPTAPTRLELMGLRFVVTPDDPDAGAGFTPPSSQEELDQLINKAVGRAHKKYEGYIAPDDPRLAAPKEKTGDGPDPDALREEGRAEVRAVLAQERVKAAFDRALTGRALSANALLDFDKSRFVSGDSADVDAINEWVKGNSIETKDTTGIVPTAGTGGGVTRTGSVDAGRDLYDKHNTKRKE